MYAVYYRPENSDSNYTVVKTKDNEIIIDGLDPDTNYNLALVSANALGHSPFVEAKILNNADGNVLQPVKFWSSFESKSLLFIKVPLSTNLVRHLECKYRDLIHLFC